MECLASLNRDAKSYDSLWEQLSAIVDAAILCLKSGDGSTAARMMEELKTASVLYAGWAKRRNSGTSDWTAVAF